MTQQLFDDLQGCCVGELIGGFALAPSTGRNEPRRLCSGFNGIIKLPLASPKTLREDAIRVARVGGELWGFPPAY